MIVRDKETTDKIWNGYIIRINGKIDLGTQTVKVYIEISGEGLYEGLYLEALINGHIEHNAYEINRSLLVDETNVYVVEDNSLQLVSVEPVVYNEKTVIVKGLENGKEIVSRPVAGAYTGMTVNIFEE